MNRLSRLVNFNLDDGKFALFLSAVMRIIRVVEITSLPKAPEIFYRDGRSKCHGDVVQAVLYSGKDDADCFRIGILPYAIFSKDHAFRGIL